MERGLVRKFGEELIPTVSKWKLPGGEMLGASEGLNKAEQGALDSAVWFRSIGPTDGGVFIVDVRSTNDDNFIKDAGSTVDAVSSTGDGSFKDDNFTRDAGSTVDTDSITGDGSFKGG